MNVNTRDLDFVKFNGMEMDFVKFNGVTIYEAWKKLIASGVPITLQNCKKANLLDYKIYGNTIQVGKNLITYPYVNTSNTYNGVEIIDNGDGTITLNGTATANITFNIVNKRNSFFQGVTHNKTYTLSLNAEGTYTGNVNVTINQYIEGVNNYLSWLSANTSKSNSGVLNEKATGLRGYFYIYSGASFENTILKPQLELGGVKTEWKTSVPNTETPIEIESVGEYDEETRKYKIPVKVSDGLGNVTTTNIYLNEPLRKINDYVDYLDFEKKQVVRNIYNEFITTIAGTSSTASTYKIFLCLMEKTPKYANFSGIALSNKFISYTNSYAYLGNKGGYIQSYITSKDLNRIALTFNDPSITTLEQANEKIGDGFDVCYILAEPIIEENVELPDILLNKCTNVIEVVDTIQPTEMKVKYFGKGEPQTLSATENIILNSILDDGTETEIDMFEDEILQKLDEIIGG